MRGFQEQKYNIYLRNMFNFLSKNVLVNWEFDDTMWKVQLFNKIMACFNSAEPSFF